MPCLRLDVLLAKAFVSNTVIIPYKLPLAAHRVSTPLQLLHLHNPDCNLWSAQQARGRVGNAMDLDQQTENLVWQLHRQLNDLRPRAGRAGAHALTTQLSLERARRGRAKQQGTESGSREHSRRRRSSDGGGGGGEQQHTSARRVKKEPIGALSMPLQHCKTPQNGLYPGL